jgi:hypothetical protein
MIAYPWLHNRGNYGGSGRDERTVTPFAFGKACYHTLAAGLSLDHGTIRRDT